MGGHVLYSWCIFFPLSIIFFFYKSTFYSNKTQLIKANWRIKPCSRSLTKYLHSGSACLESCSPWAAESDMAERLNNNRITEREEKQNSKIAQMENWVNQHLPEKTAGWKWRGRGTAQGSSPGRLLRLPSSEGLCVRGEGVWWTQGVVAGLRTKKGKGKGKGASTFQGDLVERIQNWIGSNHWWFILRKSQRGSFPSFPPPVSALGISQAKRAAQFESLSLRNQEMITWNRSTSLLRTVNPVFTRILLAIIYLQSNLNSCKSIYYGTPEVFPFSFCTISSNFEGLEVHQEKNDKLKF